MPLNIQQVLCFYHAPGTMDKPPIHYFMFSSQGPYLHFIHKETKNYYNGDKYCAKTLRMV